jgi:16S rRNA processing protein RimM
VFSEVPSGNDLITIGRIVKVVGLKGEVKVLPFTRDPKRFGRLLSVYIVSPEGKERRSRIKGVRYGKGGVILSLEGYHTPEEASGLLNYLIKIPKRDLEPLPEGEYYIFELLGIEVFTDEGVSIGKLTDILSTGSNDVYVVRKGTNEYLIPAIREVVKEIDVERRKMVIHPMEGLLD